MSTLNGKPLSITAGLLIAEDIEAIDDITAGDDVTVGDDIFVGDQIVLTGGGVITTTANGPVQITPHGTGISQFGDAGTPGHLSTPTNDDVFISGRLEVDGITYHDGYIVCAGDIFTSYGLGIGGLTSPSAILTRNASQTVNTTALEVCATSRTLLVYERGDGAYDRTYAQQVNPTIAIFSSNQSTDEHLTLAHDQTNAVVGSGKGVVQVVGNTGTHIGSGSPAHLGTPTSGDLYVGNRLEVESTSYLKGTTRLTGDLTITAAGYNINNSNAATGAIEPYTYHQTSNGISLFTGTNNNAILCQFADRATDLGHSAATNPTLFIHSADATEPTQYLGLAHTSMAGMITSGEDRLMIEPHTCFCKHRFEDSFIHTAAVYTNFWDTTTHDVEAGAGASNAVDTTAGVGGRAKLTSGDNALDVECSSSVNASYSRKFDLASSCKAMLDGSLAGKEVRFGFSDSPFSTGGAESSYCYFKFDYSADAVNWWHSSDNGTDASLGVGPTADTIQDLAVFVDASGNAKFAVDKTIVATVSSAVAADTGFYLFFGIMSEGAANETLYIENITMSWGDE